MKRNRMIAASFALLFIPFIGMAAVESSDVKKLSDGSIVVSSTSTNEKVRLRVLTDDLVRVSAIPREGTLESDGLFSTEPSLMVLPSWNASKAVPYELKEEKAFVSLKTKTLKVIISRATGEVSFFDIKTGKRLLAESKEGGRSFQPIEVEGKKAYAVRQEFESTSADEGFYGLGQHQSDEFNYKGKNEELFQYNTKVSVPFIVSTEGYGVLWDSNSLSRFGNSQEYLQLNRAFSLYDKDTKKGGLTGTYLSMSRDSNRLVRTEDSLYYENQKSILNFPKGFSLYGSKVTYEGFLEPHESGDFHFILYYAGYVKVYIDEKLIVPERWRTAWNPNSYKFILPMQKGKRVHLRIDWQPDGGTSYLGLRALTPVAESKQQKMAWWSEMNKQIDYYFIRGDNMDQVVGGYRTLTGRAPIMPKWAMGYWQSRERYKTQDELLGTLKEFRKRKIPIDNIVLDWNYWPEDQWGSHEFDLSRFPNPKAMVDSVHALKAHLMISVWPKFYQNTAHFKAFDEKGWMYRQAIKDSIRDWVGPGYVGSFYDAYNPQARQLFWQQMKEHLYSLGIDAWWMDASEPNIRDCTDMEYRKKLCGPTALGPSTQYFNAYALMNAEAIYDGQRSVDPNQRVFLLTRSGFGGLQRYSTATWSGDIATRWEDMKAQISAGLNFSVSGIPYWTMDIGGFCVESRYVNAMQTYQRTHQENADLKEWRELNTRWYQFGAFAPLFRAHGQYPFREIWNIAPEEHPAYESILYYTKLRYNLMPYIYSLASMTWFKDYTIMRPLVMDYPMDKVARNVSDEYLFGPSLLVCPVYKYGARSREVYFPAGADWYEAYSGTVIKGGQTQQVNAPYERIPLYIPSGSIIPYNPKNLQYTDEQPADTLTLYVYAGKDGKFTLYEDESTNYNYEKGKYAMIPIQYNEAKRELIIGERKGEFKGMLRERTFQVVYVTPNAPVPLGGFGVKKRTSEITPMVSVNYKGSAKTLKL